MPARFVLSIFLSIYFWSPSLADQPPLEILVEEANNFYTAGDYTQATKRYLAAAEQQPDSAIVQHNLGLAYYKQLDFPNAVKHFAQALGSLDPHTASRAHYHLAHLRHQQALDAMLSFQDAMTPIRSALEHYRASLRLEPQQHDTRYNLEQAQRLWIALRNQNVLEQANAGTRDQKISDNRGQSSEESADQNSDQREAPPEQNEQNQTQGQQARQAPKSEAQTQSGAQTEQASIPQALSPEQVEELIELVRDNAQVAADRHQQSRRAQLREAGPEKIW